MTKLSNESDDQSETLTPWLVEILANKLCPSAVVPATLAINLVRAFLDQEIR